MWLERAREILALKEAGDIAILAGAAVTAFGLSFALPSSKGIEPDAAEQATVVVSLPQRAPAPVTAPVPRPAVKPPSSSAPTAPGDTGALARQLQSELKRVGCYDGDVHGVWSKSTRAAMKSFTERVNARLPVDKPDHILLALLQGHQGRACAVACGEGQVPHADGRCVAEAAVAKASHKPDAAEAGPPKVADAPSIVPPAPVAAIRQRPPAPAPPLSEARPVPAPRPARDEPLPTRPLPEAARAPETHTPSAGREKHAEHEPAPDARGNRGRNSARNASYRQIRYARSIYRSLKRAANALPFP